MSVQSQAVALLSGVAPDATPIISVIIGRQYAIDGQGCIPLDSYVLQQDLIYYPYIPQSGRIRPSLLQRDMDLYTWRSYTDLVVQGTARSDRPRSSMSIRLSCTGPRTRIEHEILATGDRFVDVGTVGKLCLSQPQPFTELPVRYDKAYGGTDEQAEARLADADEMALFRDICGEDEDRELSEYSYPRNPAGKGYLIDPTGVRGLPWPNLEFPGERLQLDRLAAPLTDWDERPYPACFDWFPHAWFPRVAFFGDYPETSGGRIPAREAQLGLLAAGLTEQPLLDRPKHGFAQGAHPYLARSRLQGDETICLSAMSRDGRDLVFVLPDARPTIALRSWELRNYTLSAELDLCFIETDRERLTLVWRGTTPIKQTELPADWAERCTLTIK